MMRLGLAFKSLWSRRLSVGLTLLGIALSAAMILAVERVRVETRESFTQTLSGTDLVVGARTSPVQLLLYSVFRIGDATNSIRMSSFEKISRHPMVRWAIPLSLGDSHQGFRVLGTTPAYFEHLRFGNNRSLVLASGRLFEGRFDAVAGAGVAALLGYRPGAAIAIAHGARDDGLGRHDELPFTVTGVLAPTGTPVDRTIHIQLAAVEAIHVGWASGVRVADQLLDPTKAEAVHLEPDEITALFMGLERRSDVFQMQRAINQFADEPLLAILPGVALNELWSLFSIAELALLGVAAMTVVTGLIGMVVGIYATLNERRREMAVLRSVGARPRDVFTLLVLESTTVALLGAVAGYVLLTLVVTAANPWLLAGPGIAYTSGLPGSREYLLMAVIVFLGFLTGTVPAWRAYRLSLQDGLSAGH